MGLPVITIDQALDGTSIAEGIAGALDITASDGELIKCVGEAFDDEPHVVIVDDAVVGLAGPIEQILLCSEGVRIIVTSHVRLGLAGEQVVRVPGLDLPVIGASARDISRSSAVLLFCGRALAADPTFVINRSNASDIAEVCRVLDGLPLDIELAAARTQLLTPTDLLRELTSGAGLDTLGDVRRRSLDKTCGLLSARAWTVLRNFGVIAGNPRLDDIDAMTALPRADVVAGLSELIDAELVRRLQDDDFVRLGCSMIVRDYLRARVGELAELEALRDRHAEHIRVRAIDLAAHLFGPRRSQVLTQLEVELPDLMVALDQFVKLGDRLGVSQLAVALGPIAFHRNDHDLARRIVSLFAPHPRGPNEAEAMCWAIGVLGDQCPNGLNDRAARAAALALAMIPSVEPGHGLRMLAAICETLDNRHTIMASVAISGRTLAADLNDDWAFTRFTIWLADAMLRVDRSTSAVELTHAGYAASCALNDRFLKMRSSLALHNLPASEHPIDPAPLSLDQIEALAIELGDFAAITYARAITRPATLPEASLDGPQPKLTHREIEVVRLMSDGWTNKEIAARLSISPKTIMHHTASIYRKLDVHGRAGAVSARLRGQASNPT